jgi:cephalosporin hydroxylase
MKASEYMTIKRKIVGMVDRVLHEPFVAKTLGKILSRRAPTGISNNNLLAVTRHSFLKFPLNRYNIWPQQVDEEILELMSIIRDFGPKVVLEIGTARGGTLFMFTRIVDPRATLISLDWDGGELSEDYPPWKIPFYKTFTLPGQELSLLRGNSHDDSTLIEINRILNGRQVDFLFIDADHSYEGVSQDFSMYSPLVRKGGIIAFHDIKIDTRENLKNPRSRVSVFWDEIKKNYSYNEFISTNRPAYIGVDAYGIGVLYNDRKNGKNP